MISRNAQRLTYVDRRRGQSDQRAKSNTTANGATNGATKNGSKKSRNKGLSLVEMLVSLAITALLLTATMVAIDASFKAYAVAAETASTQTATRMVVNRLLTLIRTSTAHGPVLGADPGETIASSYLELIDPEGNFIRVEYRDAVDEIWVIITPFPHDTSVPVAQPLLSGVTACTFYTHPRLDDDGTPVLARASIEMEVEAANDNTLAIENSETPTIKVVASTTPRRLD